MLKPKNKNIITKKIRHFNPRAFRHEIYFIRYYIKQENNQKLAMLIPNEDDVEYVAKCIAESYPDKDQESAYLWWKKIFSAPDYFCPSCQRIVPYVRKTKDDEVVGCDRCLRIQGYYVDDKVYNGIED